ncbi:MAG: FAD-binding protein [Planctomycetota bacterium]|nr:FAD-binding protein [Planctomycetota bacterium]
MSLDALTEIAPRIGERAGAPLLAPRTLEDLERCVAFARDAGQRLSPTGNGTRLALGAQGAGGDAWLHTPALVPTGESGILEYVSGDGTLTARAGASMDTLRAAVAEGGHRITPLLPAGSTLGGVLAAGRSGPDRQAFGPMRHHVLGMICMDGNGRVHRSGGRLVKNVTGFDLHRLHAGAQGRFGVVLEASLRLVPRAEAEVLLVSRVLSSTADAARAALHVRDLSGLKLTGLVVEARRVHVLLTGREAQIDADAARVHSALDVEEECAGEAATDALLGAWRGDAGLRLLTRPSRCAKVIEVVAAAGVREDALSVEPGAAIVVVPAEEAIRCAAALSAETAPRLVELGVTFDARMPDAPAWCAQPRPGAAATWTRRLEEAFDPAGVFAPAARGAR